MISILHNGLGDTSPKLPLPTAVVSGPPNPPNSSFGPPELTSEMHLSRFGRFVGLAVVTNMLAYTQTDRHTGLVCTQSDAQICSNGPHPYTLLSETELGHWVNGSSFTSGSPGHHFDPV